MIKKVLKDLKAEENIIEQMKNSIKNLDKRIIETQNPYTRLPDLFHITASAARSAATTVQTRTL